MKFKELDEPIVSSDLYYDLMQGYIDPEKLLENPEMVTAVKEAIYLLGQFLDLAEAEGVLEVA